MKIKLIMVGVLAISLIGCSTPGVVFRDNGDEIEISPKGTDSGILNWLFGSGLKAGEYECQFSEYKKAKFSTKTDMQLLDLNLSKVDE